MANNNNCWEDFFESRMGPDSQSFQWEEDPSIKVKPGDSYTRQTDVMYSQRDALGKFLKKCKAVQRRVVCLRICEGLGYKDIGIREGRSTTWAYNVIADVYALAGDF